MAIDVLDQVTEAYAGWQARWGIEQYLFAAQGNDIDFSTKSDVLKADGFGQRVKNGLPGMQEGTLKVKGIAAMERGALIWQLRQWQGRKSPVNAWVAFQGNLALGAPITFLPASVTDSSMSAKLADPVDFNLSLNARGAYDDGVILLSPENLLTGSSGTGPSDNNTAFTLPTGGVTTNGGAGILHVWAFDGGTSPSVTVTIQHSPDNSTWTNLVSFNAMTAVGSQRIQLPSTTSINTYTQAIWSTSGTPTDVQVLCALSRYPNLNV